MFTSFFMLNFANIYLFHQKYKFNRDIMGFKCRLKPIIKNNAYCNVFVPSLYLLLKPIIIV